jgi:integrase/recombinase XerD
MMQNQFTGLLLTYFVLLYANSMQITIFVYKVNNMKQDYSISIYLDTRRAKSNKLYPVKLRVFTPIPRRQKLYPTIFEFNEKEFNSIWNTTKPRKEYQEKRKEILSVESKAIEVAKLLKPFTFEQFEKQLFRNPGDGIKLKYHYENAIAELKAHNQVGTASTYSLSQSSIKKYVEEVLNLQFDKLTFFEITSKWLTEYEFYMTNSIGRSLTTVSMYLRVLRTLFNKAIDEQEIDKVYYPFGKRKYQVPATKNVKKALSKKQLKLLFDSKPETKEQQKAKDFWFFSFACNGMNIKDIVLLKYEDIQDGKIIFYRAKTRNTSKGNLKPVTAYLNEYTTGVIERYGNTNKSQQSHVFSIITKGLPPQETQARIKNFTRFINQHLKKLCKDLKLPDGISTYWARHSFTTNAIRNGATMEFLQESLGHGNISTTQNYFAGFDDETKKEFANSMMSFE